MTLKVWTPTGLVLDEEIGRLKAESETGWFGVLPRHVDFVTSLVPGILKYELRDRQPGYLAIDRGVLVKCGPVVSVSARNAVRGGSLETLRNAVREQFRKRAEKEQASRKFEAKLEADLVRRLMRLKDHA